MKIDQKILIVDDEPDFRKPLAKIFSRRGLLVDTAESCSQAMAKMTIDPFDVIVMDVSMPEIDGIHCLMLIKQEWPGVEVIILTGHASVDSGIEGMKGEPLIIVSSQSIPMSFLKKLNWPVKKCVSPVMRLFSPE